MKICVFGNSVAFKMRPPRANHGELTYGELMERDGHQVANVSRAGVTLGEMFATLDDDVVTRFPDVVILQFGVVEVCKRNTWRYLNNLGIQNYYLNRVFDSAYLSDTLTNRSVRLCVRIANAVWRRSADMLGLRWQWMSSRDFLEVLNATLAVLIKETSAKVIVAGLNPCSARVERLLTGSVAALQQMDEALKAAAKARGPRVLFADVRAALKDHNLDECVPDGVHFSHRGHRVFYELVSRMLAENSEVSR